MKKWLPPTLAGISFLATSFLLALGWSVYANGPLADESEPLRTIGEAGYRLGYWIYGLLEATSGFFGYTTSYERLIGLPLLIALTIFPVVTAAIVWLLSSLIFRVK
jgi:hypothetical protein